MAALERWPPEGGKGVISHLSVLGVRRTVLIEKKMLNVAINM